MREIKPRGKRDTLYPLDSLLVTVHRSAAGTLWRWRTEITALGALAAATWWLWGQLHSLIWVPAVLAAAAGLAFGLPWPRRFITARIWCALARHRFQRLCWEARLHTRAGRVPPVLLVRPTKVGERLFVWCLAGISAEDFENHTGEIRAACYAREARVTRNTRWSHLVTIDIIRRDTLAASHTVGSPLKALAARPARPAATSGTNPPVPDLTDLTDPAWPDGPAWGDVLAEDE